ncbi:hypothetical protein L1049_023155 [Liquidambar formosana]|uniref:Uncharacterized protein n=1 Tax=Liquidambar formosana TaxID=63359 RepID=A0AAP0RFH8_LIQFO
MASACVNNIGMSPENFPATYPSYGWLSPRISFSREFPDEDSKVAGAKPPSSAVEKPLDPPDVSDPEVSGKEVGDFEFRLDDPVTMLPADELFSDGKLVPLQVSVIRPAVTLMPFSSETRSPETAKSRRRTEVSSSDQYMFSPKAPRCSSRWKELLGLKKLYQNNPKQDNPKTTSSSSSSSSHSNSNSKSLKNFLHRNSKSSSSASDASLSLPLLKDSDCESVSISSRLSLSSSSSGHEHEDLPRLSLDSEKSNQNPISLNKNPNPPRVRVVKPRAVSSSDNPTASRVGRSPMRRAPAESGAVGSRGASVDSPRMNSSGKIVFQSLERSSSSPSSFNGGPRFKHRGVERSYSANVRITPVLNVPVCSLRGSSKSGVFGFGQLFSSPQKRESGGSSGGNGGGNRSQQSNTRNRTDRT